MLQIKNEWNEFEKNMTLTVADLTGFFYVTTYTSVKTTNCCERFEIFRIYNRRFLLHDIVLFNCSFKMQYLVNF